MSKVLAVIALFFSVSILASPESLQNELADLEASLQSNQYRLTRAQKNYQEALVERGKVSKQLDEAIDAVKKNPENESLVREATRVSIDFNRTDSSVERYQSRIERFTEKNQQLEKKIAQKNKQLEREVAARNARHKRNAEREAARAAQSKKAEKRRVVASSSKPAPQPKRAAAKADWPSATRHSTASIAYAKRRLAELNRLQSSGNVGTPLLNNVKIEGRVSNINEEMVYMGQNLYLAEARVKQGSQVFKVFNQSYTTAVPKKDSGAIYIFLYDITRISSPRLISFNRDLLH